MPLQRNDDFLVVSRASNDTSYKVKYEKIVQEATSATSTTSILPALV